METSRVKMLEALNQVSPGLSSSGLGASVHSWYVFSNNTVGAYNDFVSVVVPVDIEDSFIVPSMEFYEIVKRAEGDKIDFSLKGSSLIVKSGSYSASLVLREGEEMSLPSVDGLTMHRLPKDFVEGIQLCMFSATKDLSLGAMVGVSVNGSRVSSSDDFRASVYEMDRKVVEPFLLPVFFISSLCSFAPTKYAVDKTWIHFSNRTESVFSARAVLGEFPDVLPLVKSDGVVIDLPKSLGDIVTRVKVLGERDFSLDREVRVEIGEGKLLCRGEKEGIGKVWEEIDFVSETSVIFDVNPDFLLQILRHTNKVSIEQDPPRAIFSFDKFSHALSLVVG